MKIGIADRGQVEEEVVEGTVRVNDRCLSVRLLPGAQVRLELGMERFVNKPSYALPW